MDEPVATLERPQDGVIIPHIHPRPRDVVANPVVTRVDDVEGNHGLSPLTKQLDHGSTDSPRRSRHSNTCYHLALTISRATTSPSRTTARPKGDGTIRYLLPAVRPGPPGSVRPVEG